MVPSFTVALKCIRLLPTKVKGAGGGGGDSSTWAAFVFGHGEFIQTHSLTRVALKYAKVRAAVAKTKTKTIRATPAAACMAKGEKGVGSELQADNGDGGVALRGCLRSAVVARGSRRANDEWQGREGGRGLCHPRRLHANWLKCEFM